MARFEVSGLEAVISDMTRMGQMTGTVADAMLMAGAAVITQHWVDSARAHGHVDTGDMIASIGFPRKPRSVNDARTLDVYPQGKDYKGTRNAEKAFILHYGSSSIKGSRWVEDAEAEAEQPAGEAMIGVWDEFIATGKVRQTSAPKRRRAGKRKT